MTCDQPMLLGLAAIICPVVHLLAAFFPFFACETVGAKDTANAATAIARTIFLIMFTILCGPPIKAGKIFARVPVPRQATEARSGIYAKKCDRFATLLPLS